MGMLRKISSVQRLAFGVTCVFVSLVLFGAFLGLVPDERSLKIDARARVSEALAIQLASFAMQGDYDAVSAAIGGIVARDPKILSIGVRKADGEIVASSQEHARNWGTAAGQGSSPTHVDVPLMSDNAHWGDVEITFRDLDTVMMITGLSRQFLLFVIFMALSGLATAYFVLRRSLKELDPKRAVPKRVQNAFDSLSDGVAIIDEEENVLLLNGSLGQLVGVVPEQQIGRRLSAIGWNAQLLAMAPETMPWRPVLRDHTNIRDTAFTIQSRTGETRNLLVNATCLRDDGGKFSGAIVAFKDVTALERKNQELAVAIDRLSQSESEVRQQNRQLHYLASHDPLTGCMNRRSFFQQLDGKFQEIAREYRPLICLMIDIDHFKSINDELGHAAGDDVIAGLGQLLQQLCRSDDLVGRYGGEEFCMILEGISQRDAISIAQRIRAAVSTQSMQWLADNRKVTVSIGLTQLQRADIAPGDFIEQADQALYLAKRGGRDRVVTYGESEATRLAV